MYNIDVSLIKMITDHYWIKRDNIVQKSILEGESFLINSNVLISL
jgi:hypothetical protein